MYLNHQRATVQKSVGDNLATALRVLLANVISLDARVDNAYYNVTGSQAPSYTSMFQDLGWTTDCFADPIARALRYLNEPAPFLLSDVVALRSIEEPTDVATDVVSITKDLLAAFAATIASVNAALAEAVYQPSISESLVDLLGRIQDWTGRLAAIVAGE